MSFCVGKSSFDILLYGKRNFTKGPQTQFPFYEPWSKCKNEIRNHLDAFVFFICIQKVRLPQGFPGPLSTRPVLTINGKFLTHLRGVMSLIHRITLPQINSFCSICVFLIFLYKFVSNSHTNEPLTFSLTF